MFHSHFLGERVNGVRQNWEGILKGVVIPSTHPFPKKIGVIFSLEIQGLNLLTAAPYTAMKLRFETVTK